MLWRFIEVRSALARRQLECSLHGKTAMYCTVLLCSKHQHRSISSVARYCTIQCSTVLYGNRALSQ
jgi:hypothetical protein